jgi:hypothetical protein
MLHKYYFPWIKGDLQVWFERGMCRSSPMALEVYVIPSEIMPCLAGSLEVDVMLRYSSLELYVFYQ